MLSNPATARWQPVVSPPMVDKAMSLDQLRQMSSREVADKVFEAMETLTWRAANLQPTDLKRLSETPLRLWEKRQELSELLIEKGAQFLAKNGKPTP